MNAVIYKKASGVIVQSVVSPHTIDDLIDQFENAEVGVIEGVVKNNRDYRVVGGVIQYDPQPDDFYVRSESGNWVDGRTPESIQFDLTSKVQSYLDNTARARSYDGILSLCSYASSPHPKFGPEGRAGVAWRDAVWAKCYEILADVEAQVRPVPSEAELLAELPAMVWPE